MADDGLSNKVSFGVWIVANNGMKLFHAELVLTSLFVIDICIMPTRFIFFWHRLMYVF